MVRNYKRKTDRSNLDEGKFKLAIKDVLSKKFSISESARICGLSRTTLRDRVTKINKKSAQAQDNSENSPDDEAFLFSSKYSARQIFTKKQENELSEYFKECSNLQHGFTYSAARKFVFDYADVNDIKSPVTWASTKTAGLDWMQGFMKRNNGLSLRKPENTSLSRCTSFTKTAVMAFFDNVQTLYSKYSFKPVDIYNLDETGITTVLPPPKVISARGKRTVSQVASAERGSLVTMVGIINAAGNALPPVYVFPRVNYKEHFVNGGPNGCVGIAAKSGWMSTEGFCDVLTHIQKNTRCSTKTPILLFLDNHVSHCSLAAITFCRDNGIHMLSFPPHSSHKLQPLDISVFGPFKRYLTSSYNDFLCSNPGRTITIYDIPQLSKIPFQKAFVSENICKGFAAAGINPFNREVFPESDFVDIATGHTTADDTGDDAEPDTACELVSILPPKKTPDQVRPLPKLNTPENSSNPRKGSSKILTSTPSKQAKEKTVTKKIRPRKSAKKAKRGLNFKKRRSSDESSEDSKPISLADTDKSTGSFVATDNININNYVLVRFGSQTEKYYVGRIVGEWEDLFEIEFLRKKNQSWVFFEPAVKDISYVPKIDIVLKLPEPFHPPGTSRSGATFIFESDLTQFNVT